MPHTQSSYMQDLGFADGVVFLDAVAAIATGGASVLTRNAAGDLSHNAGASVAPIYSFNLGRLLQRTGVGEDLQEQFGGTGIAGSAAPQGRPPFTGASQLAPRIANKLKGVKLLSFGVAYSITGAALTAHTCRVDKSVFANNVAVAISSVLASAANGLATATQANPYVTEVALAAGQQIYRVSDLSQYWVEVAPTTQGGGAYRMYGIRVKFEFNYN